jgi:hypothetical protein
MGHPAIANNPKRTPAIVSLSDLQELKQNFLSNNVL